jgi:mono/diheme cytochrome c family protein
VRRSWFFLLAVPALASAQTSPSSVKQGEQVFAKTCSIGYCHGSRGGVGGAPRLVARGFNREFILSTVTGGVAGTAMPAFGKTMSRPDLNAVVAYVASLNGLVNPASAAQQKPLSAEAERGRALFFDAVRSFGRCATCHEVNGVGVPVAAPIGKVPADARALRALETPRVSTTKVDGESMPALVVSKGKARTVFFDLTSAPPVQRAVDSSAIEVTEGSAWKHSAAITAYNDAELAAIVSYLKAVAQ